MRALRIRDSGSATFVVELRRVDGTPHAAGDRRLLRQGGRRQKALCRRRLDQLRRLPQRVYRNRGRRPATRRRRPPSRLLPSSTL